jgi:kumamolisin
MSSSEPRVPLRGSERQPMAARGRRRPDSAGLPAHQSHAIVLNERQYLSREEYGAAHGAAEQDILRVEAFALTHQLRVEERSAARRTVVLSGSAQSMAEAFGVQFQRFEHSGGTYRGRVGAIYIPPELAEAAEGIFGLDNRPQAEPHFRLKAPIAATVGAGIVGTESPPTRTRRRRLGRRTTSRVA